MLRLGDAIVVLTLALLCVGVVMVTSADMRVRPRLEPAPVVADAPAGPTPAAEPLGPGQTSLDEPAMGAMGRTLRTSAVIYAGASMLLLVAVSLVPMRRVAWLMGADRTVPIAGANHEEPGVSARGLGHGTDGVAHAMVDRLARAVHPALAGPRLDLILPGVVVLGLVIGLVLVYVPGLMSPRNGSNRWVLIPGLGGLTMQPSEIAKWSMVVALAWFIARRGESMRSMIRGLLPALAATGLVCAMIAKEDLGTAALIGSAMCLVLLAGGARWRHFAMMLPLAAAGLVAAVWLAPYRIRRLITFLEPYADPREDGYHIIQSLLAIANGELTGRGLGYGLQKLGYLPEDRTDFLFAVVCEELGVAGAAGVVALLVALVWCVLLVARSSEVVFLKLWCYGIAATIGLQTVINLFVVTGLAPTKGIALPLVSYGGTGWMLTAVSLGVVVAVDRAARASDRMVDRPGTLAAA